MKVTSILLTVVFLAVVLAAQTEPKPAGKADKGATATSAKEHRWQGYVIRINKDQSTMNVRRGNTPRTIKYDNATEWTKMGKPSSLDEIKDGSFVIVVGAPEKNGVFHATRVDLRLPR